MGGNGAAHVQGGGALGNRAKGVAKGSCTGAEGESAATRPSTIRQGNNGRQSYGGGGGWRA